MKKLLLLLFSVVTFSVSAQNIPQLQAGVFVYDTLTVYTFGFTDTCDAMVVQADIGLIPVANGVGLKLLVSQLTTPADSAYTQETGTIHLNDSLPFSLSYQYYTFRSHSPGQIKVKVILTGTPVTQGEQYPCQWTDTLVMSGPTCLMFVATLYAGQNQCTVSSGIGIAEINGLNGFSIHPNPSSDYFEITFPEGRKPLSAYYKIYNTLGSLVKQQTISGQSAIINREGLENGIYFIRVSAEEGEWVGKVIIE